MRSGRPRLSDGLDGEVAHGRGDAHGGEGDQRRIGAGRLPKRLTTPAVTTQSREWLAALEIRARAASIVGEGVPATASYTARSRAPSSRPAQRVPAAVPCVGAVADGGRTPDGGGAPSSGPAAAVARRGGCAGTRTRRAPGRIEQLTGVGSMHGLAVDPDRDLRGVRVTTTSGVSRTVSPWSLGVPQQADGLPGAVDRDGDHAEPPACRAGPAGPGRRGRPVS